MKIRIIGIVIVLTCLVIGCKNSVKLDHKHWTQAMSLYEVMPKNFSATHDIQGVLSQLKKIRAQFITGLVLLPLSPTEDGSNLFNPGDPYASINLTALDTNVADEKTFNLLIDSCHHFKIKIFLELNLSYTGPSHPWRKENPDFYQSNEEQENGKYNQKFVALNLENKSLQSKLLKAVKYWSDRYALDGIVVVNGEEFTDEFWTKISKIVHGNGQLLIASAQKPALMESGVVDSYFNLELYSLFQKMAASELKTSDFKNILQTNQSSKIKSSSIMFNQNAVTNRSQGSEYNRCQECYKQCALLTYLLGGVPWVLNGQEGPAFDGINTFKNEVLSDRYNYNRDFYRALNIHRRENAAMNSLLNNLPVLISDSEEVLAFERKHGNLSIMFMGNLTNKTVQYTINKDFRFYTEFFTRALVSFEPNVIYTLAPYQYIMLTNLK
ncbi:MAG: hypothetical protein IPH93_04630 [Saprospiraceae bacterium]|nr:hypothetical protein [Saprospiraceae bacterium]